MNDRLPIGEPANDLSYYPTVETHLLRSKYVQQVFKIQVKQPVRKRSLDAPGAEQPKLPVIYATDGNMSFDMFAPLLNFFRTPVMLVGIGYPGDSTVTGALLRARDMTAPPYIQWGELPGASSEGMLVAEEGGKNFYGGENFLQFIGNELFPFIDQTYATSPGERMYFGHSLGGFFGLFTMLTRPEFFKGYIVSSPGVIYHGTAPGGIPYDDNDFGLEMIRQFAASGKSLDSKRLYLSAGTDEEFQPGLENWRLTSSVYRLAKVINAAKIPGLEFMLELFNAEDHGTVWPMAFIHGVQAMLGERRIATSCYL